MAKGTNVEMNLTDHNYHMEARRKQDKISRFCNCEDGNVGPGYLPSFGRSYDCTKSAANPHIGRTDEKVIMNTWAHRDPYFVRKYDQSDKGPVLDTTWREVRNSIGLSGVPRFKPDPKDTNIFVPSFEATFGKSTAFSKPYGWTYSGSGGCNCG